MSPPGRPKGEFRSAKHEGTPVKTFIKAVEYWVPGNDRLHLEYGGGRYGHATRFAVLSRKLCFGRGEGLPGKAWELGHPLLLLFGDGDDHAGAIELWHNEPAASKDMVLADGHYGRTAEAFEFLSRRTSFRRGTGLPGMAWDSGLPVFLPDLGKGSRFLRSHSALQVGINRGFALACTSTDGQHHVAAFLSALDTPIVRRFEVWQRDGEYLARVSGFCEVQGVLTQSPALPHRGQGTLGRAFLTGVPAIGDDALSEPAGLAALVLHAGVHTLVAIPVLREGRCMAVMAWYF